MIGKLTGTITPFGGYVLVETGGVGYLVRVPAAVLTEARGQEVSLYVYTAVREDAIDLYGFSAEEDLSFFKLLTGVSGVGPKTALGIMSVADTASLKRTIAAGDAAALTKIFGVGKKSAERIVLELREKVGPAGGAAAFAAGTSDADVAEALMSLGYSAQESRDAIKHIEREGTLNERISAALKRLGTRL